MLDFIKIKNSALWKTISRDEKSNHRLGENTTKDTSDKRLVAKIQRTPKTQQQEEKKM